MYTKKMTPRSSTSPELVYISHPTLYMPEQALGGIPLGFGIVEDKPSELSCNYPSNKCLEKPFSPILIKPEYKWDDTTNSMPDCHLKSSPGFKQQFRSGLRKRVQPKERNPVLGGTPTACRQSLCARITPSSAACTAWQKVSRSLTTSLGSSGQTYL